MVSSRWYHNNHVLIDRRETYFGQFYSPEILDYALRCLYYRPEYSAVGFQFLPAEFTLTELQNTDEIILDEKLDQRNFRPRMLQSGIIEQTERMCTGKGCPGPPVPLPTGCRSRSQSQALVSLNFNSHFPHTTSCATYSTLAPARQHDRTSAPAAPTRPT